MNRKLAKNVITLFVLMSNISCASLKHEVTYIGSVDDLNVHRKELDGKWIRIDGYISYYKGTITAKPDYYELHGSELYQSESGETVNRCSSGDDTGVFIEKLGVMNRLRDMDRTHVVVTGLYEDKVVEVPFESISILYSARLTNVKVEKIYGDKCERIQIMGH